MKGINTFIQQGCIKLIKLTVKTFYIVAKERFFFKINGFLLNYSLKNPEKCITVTTKIISGTTVVFFCFFFLQISEGSCDTEDWRRLAALHHRNKLHLIYISKHLHLQYKNTFKTLFLSKICSLGEQKTMKKSY